MKTFDTDDEDVVYVQEGTSWMAYRGCEPKGPKGFGNSQEEALQDLILCEDEWNERGG